MCLLLQLGGGALHYANACEFFIFIGAFIYPHMLYIYISIYTATDALSYVHTSTQTRTHDDELAYTTDTQSIRDIRKNKCIQTHSHTRIDICTRTKTVHSSLQILSSSSFS